MTMKLPLALAATLVVAACSGGANGWMFANSGQLTGAISEAAFSFIVHDPSGIIEWTSEMSRFSSRLR